MAEAMSAGASVVRLLAGVSLFNRLSAGELAAVAGAGAIVEFETGETVFEQGSEPNALYVITAGEFAVIRGERAVIARLGPGSPFGEMGVVSGARRSATVVCELSGAAFRLDREAFQRAARQFGALGQAANWVAERRAGNGRTFDEWSAPLQAVLDRFGVFRIGSDASNDLVLQGSGVRPRHAEIYRKGNAWRVHALDADATLNHRPLEDAPLTDGDLLRLGPVRLYLQDGVLAVFRPGSGTRVDALGVSRSVGGVPVLTDVTFSVMPGEFVAIVGASGAGKSTLLRVLLGLERPDTGEVRYDGRPAWMDRDERGTQTGYVPQGPVLPDGLPVTRALGYAASLRLPGASHEDRMARVAAVMAAMGLESRSRAPVGVLSGGERKRVSIAAEMLADPRLFFLDEASSGLDPANEAHLMRELRRLADDGHTVILVTHATRNVALCDQVAFLAGGGTLVYFGPPNDAPAVFGATTFDEIYERTAFEGTPAGWVERFRTTDRYHQSVVARLPPGTAAAAEVALAADARTSPVRQFLVLTARSLETLVRDRVGLGTLLVLAPLAGLVNFIAWPRDVLEFEHGDINRAMVLTYLYSLIAVLIGSISSVREIVRERAMTDRERILGVRPGAYVASRLSVGLLLSAYHAAVLFGMLAAWVTFPGFGATDFGAVYLTLFLATLAGTTTGLLVSALAAREEQALLSIIGVVLVQIVFSGGVLPVSDLGQAGRAVASVTTDYWAFKGLTDVAGIDGRQCPVDGRLDTCTLPGFGKYPSDVERTVALEPIDDRYRDIIESDVHTAWLAMAALAAACSAGIYARQRWRRPG